MYVCNKPRSPLHIETSAPGIFYRYETKRDIQIQMGGEVLIFEHTLQKLLKMF